MSQSLQIHLCRCQLLAWPLLSLLLLDVLELGLQHVSLGGGEGGEGGEAPCKAEEAPSKDELKPSKEDLKPDLLPEAALPPEADLPPEPSLKPSLPPPRLLITPN